MPEAYTLTVGADRRPALPDPAARDAPPDAPLAVVLHGLGRHKRVRCRSSTPSPGRPARPRLRRPPARRAARRRRARSAAAGRLRADHGRDHRGHGAGPLPPAGSSGRGAGRRPWHLAGRLRRLRRPGGEPRLTVAAVAMGSPDWLGPLRDMGLPPAIPSTRPSPPAARWSAPPPLTRRAPC